MKIIELNAGVLTNYDVLSLLKSKGVSKKDTSRLIASVSASEYKLWDYLEQSPACNQTTESINECIEKCKEYDLTKSEILNIINIRLSTCAQMGSIIRQRDDRLETEGKMKKLVETVECLLPPAPTPEEDDSGEDTANEIDENFAENEDVGT